MAVSKNFDLVVKGMVSAAAFRCRAAGREVISEVVLIVTDANNFDY
jgi:hypothetical protein